ncbi:MAG: hypothetical protein RLY86_4156 [Pseudomonadota bacterium]|jgi:hypothetical protein
MARKPRHVRTGTIYYVRAETLEGQSLSDTDRTDLRAILSDSFVRTDTTILGWGAGHTMIEALLLPVRSSAVSDWLRWVLTTCTVRAHRRRGVGGSLWRRHALSTPVQAGYWAGMALASIAGCDHVGTSPTFLPVRSGGSPDERNGELTKDFSVQAKREGRITLVGMPHRLAAPPLIPESDLSRIYNMLQLGHPLGDREWVKWYSDATSAGERRRPRGRPRRTPDNHTG